MLILDELLILLRGLRRQQRNNAPPMWSINHGEISIQRPGRPMLRRLGTWQRRCPGR
jgi:hypothetical protein